MPPCICSGPFSGRRIMSQFSFAARGSPNLQCPVTASSTLGASSSASSPGLSLGGGASGATTTTTVTSADRASASRSRSPTLGAGCSGVVAPHHPAPQHPLASLGGRMAVTSAVVRPPGGSPSAVASSVSPASQSGGSVGPQSGTGGGGPGGQPGSGPPGGRCCDTGRPIFTDPLTGQTVCSCQYELLGGYQRLGALPTAALSMYSAPYAAAAAAAASEGMAAYFPGLGADQAPFYTPTAAGLELKENLGAGAAAAWPYPSVYHPYDAAFAGYPFNGYGMDLNGARRKNATRETTSTLKAWLNEHKKNPYPTKGEKIMLAIITKMTLTQVSTWFANARRRLKKENKMTWEPRNRVEDEDNNNEDDDSGRKSVDEKDRLDSKDSGTGSSEDGDRGGSASHRLDLLHGGGGPGSGLGPGRAESEWSESRADSGPDSPECLYDQREPPSRHPLHLQHHPAFLASSPHARLLRHPSPDHHSPHLHHPQPQQHAIPPSTSTSGTTSAATKPRIWSLADMASKQDHQSSEHHHRSSPQHQQQQSPGSVIGSPYSGNSGSGGGGGGGKIVSPLASRLPPHHPLHPAMHPGTQFVRHHPDFYRNFYGAPHLGSADQMSLLETYQRTLGGLMPPTSAPSMLVATSAASSSLANLKSSPFSINGSTSSGNQNNNNNNSGSNSAGTAGTGAGSPSTVLLTTTAAGAGVSPSSSSTASSNGSERHSPNPGSNLAPTTTTAELKSPGRV